METHWHSRLLAGQRSQGLCAVPAGDRSVAAILTRHETMGIYGMIFDGNLHVGMVTATIVNHFGFPIQY